MRIEETTIVDRAQYRRVKSTKETVHRILTNKLIERGVKEEDIIFHVEDVVKTGCCPQLTIKAYADII